nr:MDR family MFS transporter [uncultured Cupriavidus sp.]
MSDAQSNDVQQVNLRAVMILVTGALFMEILDGSIIATALPAMAQSFGTTAVKLNIGVSAYLLALGVFIPASGWAVDRFGARYVFALAILLFTVSSALCGIADSLPSFVAFRIVQGIAGAMMVPVGRLVVISYTPPNRLMAAMSALIWPALIAPVLGPPLGGFIATHFGWRWIFYLNLPLGMIALIAAWFVIPNARGASMRRFDWIGFVLCGAGTFMLLSGLERVAEYPDVWSAALLSAGALSVFLAVRHLRRAPAPLVGLRAFTIPTFLVAMRGGSLFRIAISSAPFLLPLMFQVGFGYDAFRSGLLVLFVFVGNLAMKSVTTPILRRFGYRTVMIWNGLFCALSLGTCALLTPDMPVPLVAAILIVAGMTRSMQFTVLGTIAYADVPKPQMPDANGLFNTLSQVAMAAGITLGALSVRAGHVVTTSLGLAAPGADYRIAFVFVAIFALTGLYDALRIAPGAADHFVERTPRKPAP